MQICQIGKWIQRKCKHSFSGVFCRKQPGTEILKTAGKPLCPNNSSYNFKVIKPTILAFFKELL